MTETGSKPSLWRWLTEPAPSIREGEARKNARLLSSLLLSVAMALLLHTLYAVVHAGSAPQPEFVVTVIVFLIGYGVSRTRLYQAAAVLALTVSVVPVLMVIYDETDVREPIIRAYLAWLALPVIVSSLFFSVRGTAILAFVLLAGIPILPVLISSLPFSSIAGGWGYVLTISVLVITALLHRNQIERDRQAQLRESERRYRSLFEDVPVGLYRTTPEGKILDANPALVEILGYPDRAPLLAVDAHTVYVDAEDRHRWQAMLQREGMVLGFEVQVRRRDGATIWVRETAHTVQDRDGRVLYYEGSLENITERKQAEQEKEHLQERLLQAQKMEAVGQLAGGIAHDFNNVLTAIQGYGAFLRDGLAPDDPGEWPAAQAIRADLGEILLAADRAASLTQQLLAFSRKQVLMPRVLNLNDLLRGMESMLRRLIGEDVNLMSSLAPDLGHVRADPGQIEQVIMNLSVNARDAMPQGGKLTFETANVELDEAYVQTHPNVEPGRYTLLAVSDNGKGMSDEVQEHLFEPFFTTKERGNGTGLGLATVYGIVEQSGGHIEVYSEEGVGTTFKVYLPLVARETDVGASTRKKADLPQGTETVLLVEDEMSVRDLACRVLAQCGYIVLAAGHPQEALALSKEHAGGIPLLITDVVMPGMSGKVLAEQLVASRPEMQVLYISGYTDNAIVHHGVLDTGVHFVQKPFTPSILARKVRELLDRAL
jgi:two-component system cell cycle sensor histidine kinase/response regulator CckA